MSWARVTATGSGAIAFRLMIPGHPYVAVSDSALAGADTDGRTRLAGLNASNVQWSESLDPAQCKLTARGFTAEIIEDTSSERWGDSFCRQPTKVSYLTASVSDVDVAIPLSTTDTANGDVLFIGTECVLITSGGGTASPTVTRGYRQTRATYHYVDDSLGLTRPEVTTEDAGAANGRPSIEGQVAFLYAYGDGETGDGTLVWRGIVATQPRLRNLTTWEITLDSVTSVLDQALSADLQDPATLRGAYYVAATLPALDLTQLSTALASGSFVARATVTLTAGLYRDNDEFCSMINTAIKTATSGWATPLNAVSGALPSLLATPTPDGAWTYVYTPGATPYWLDFLSVGDIDPAVHNAAGYMYRVSDGVAVTTLASSIPYEGITSLPIPGAGQCPRGLVGTYNIRSPRGVWSTGTSAALYLGGSTSLSTADALLVTWPDFNGQPEAGVVYGVSAWDATNRIATVDFRTRDVGRRFTPEGLPEITVLREYVSAGNVADFITRIVGDAPEFAPAGRQPYVTEDHVDYATITTNVDAVTDGRSWAESRYYAGAADINLAKMLTEEAKLVAMVPSISTDGRFILVEFRAGASTEPTSFSVTASNNLSGVQLPGFEPSAFGLLNTIRLLTGFDPVDGKHAGDSFVIRDASALSRNPLPAVMRIEPRSEAFYGDTSIPFDDVRVLAQSWFGVLGTSYAVTTVTCPLTAISAIVGTIVNLTIAQLPDTASGGRGVSLLGGIVIGRAVKPVAGTVELAVLCSDVRIAGYAPSSRVASNALVAGTTYDVTLTASQPTGYATASSWTVGDLVTLTQYNTAAPVSQTGTISAVNTSTRVIRIVLAGAIPASTLNLEYSGAAVVTTHQQTYCFIAASDRIGFATPVSARQFAA